MQNMVNYLKRSNHNVFFRLNAKAGLVEEEPSEEERKPPYSYATLIR